jgi:hypothetical protein
MFSGTLRNTGAGQSYPACVRGVFRVEEASGPRWELALDLLRRGKSFAWGPVTFSRTAVDTVEVAVASTWQWHNLTRERALRDLVKARSEVQKLLATNSHLRGAVGDSNVHYVLVNDDEVSSVAIARLVDDDLVWIATPPAD